MTTSADGTLAIEPVTDRDGVVWEIRIGDGSVQPFGTPPTSGIAIMRNGVLTNGGATQIEPQNGGIAYFLGRNGHWWTSSAFNVWADIGLSIPTPVDVAPSLAPLTFTALPADPGGKRGYTSCQALPTGELVYFGGVNGHLPDQYNGIDAFGSAGWRNIKPHAPWTTSGTDPTTGYGIATGKTNVGNRDNHDHLVLQSINKMAIFQGEREPGVIGNYQGMVDLATGDTVVDDTGGVMPGIDGAPLKLEDGATTWIPALGIGVRFCSFSDAVDYLQAVVPNPVGSVNPFSFVTFADMQGTAPSFPGAKGLRYVSNQRWAHGTQLHIYGGIGGSADLTVVELAAILTGGTPVQSVLATNTLPADQQVKGECVIAYEDLTANVVVMHDGARCNTYTYATNAWASVPLASVAAYRVTPEAGGSGAIGGYCEQLKGGVVVWATGNVELLTFGAPTVTVTPPVVTTPPPVVTAPPPSPPVTTAPPAPTPPVPTSLTPAIGNLTIVTTEKDLPTLLNPVLTGKHYGIVYIDGYWHIAFGDHVSLAETTPLPEWQDGNQQRYKWKLSDGTALQTQNYFLRSITPDVDVQSALPDDGGICAAGTEIIVCTSERVIQRTTNSTTNADGSINIGETEYCRGQWGADIVVQEMGYIMAIDTVTGVHRRVMPRPEFITGDRFWTPQYDSVQDFCFGIASNAGDLNFFLFTPAGVDLTWYGSDGKPQKLNWDSTGLGEITAHVAGLAVDWVTRTIYFYDHVTTKLFSIGIDDLKNHGTAVLRAQFSGLGEPLNQSDQTAVKIDWDPDLKCVVINGIVGIYAYDPAAHACSFRARQDGFIGGDGTYVPTSFIRWDPDGHFHFSAGTIDWSNAGAKTSNKYWQHALQAS